MEKFINSEYWTHSSDIFDIRTKVKFFYDYNKVLDTNVKLNNLKLILFLTLYIRDCRIGLNHRNISRWMLIEFELKYPGFCSSIIKHLLLFGDWEDFNLILIDIYNRKELTHLENKIYEFFLIHFKRDISFYYKRLYHKISPLVTFLGKERKSLDKKIGFPRKFVTKLFPKNNLRKGLIKYRTICSKLNNVINYEKKHIINNMFKVTKHNIVDFSNIKNNSYLFPKYEKTYKCFNQYLIHSPMELYNINSFKIKNGSYFYDDNVVKQFNKLETDLNIDENINNYCYDDYSNETKPINSIQTYLNKIYDDVIINIKTKENLNYYDNISPISNLSPISLTRKTISISNDLVSINNGLIKNMSHNESNQNVKININKVNKWHDLSNKYIQFKINQKCLEYKSLLIIQRFWKNILNKQLKNKHKSIKINNLENKGILTNIFNLFSFTKPKDEIEYQKNFNKIRKDLFEDFTLIEIEDAF